MDQGSLRARLHIHMPQLPFVLPFLDLGRPQQRFLLTQMQHNTTQCNARRGTYDEPDRFVTDKTV